MLPVQLEQGYDVDASGYRQPGWCGFSAVADNLELLERVVIDLGQPGQVIAYGQAMGGHAALQLALAPEQPLAAALPLCPIIRADQFWQAALDLTETLRKLEPKDPVKYDFALFGLGIMEKF